MINLLKAEMNKTLTENGAVTHRTTGNACLDLFSTIGALREASISDIISRFVDAYDENPDIAMKILFFARDIRGGLGERNIFRIIFHACSFAPQFQHSIFKNIKYVSEYGRWDDLWGLLLNADAKPIIISIIKKQLQEDLHNLYNKKSISLMGKWLPSINASNKDTIRYGRIIAEGLGLSERMYRKTLSKLRKYIDIIETHLTKKDYTFDYSKVPSKAMLKYRYCFMNKDGDRYNQYLEDVKSGKVKINANTLYPYEILRSMFDGYYDIRYIDENELKSIETLWKNLPDYTNNENSIVVCDGSGSMYSMGNPPKPIEVAVSLSLYFAERNKGAFKNHFITFSENPQMIEIKGSNIVDKMKNIMKHKEVANTNIQKVFEVILNTAIKNKVPQSELPTTIYIISDMEFDRCTEDASLTNFEYAKRIFKEAGYTLPRLVFWNVQSRNQQQPVTQNEQGVALVSGCTPKIFEMVTEGSTPYEVMMDILNSDRYKIIEA